MIALAASLLQGSALANRGAPVVPGSVEPTASSMASKSIMLKRSMKFDGKSWLMTIHASDMDYGDYVSVGFSKATVKKNSKNKLIYKLRENQSYGFGTNTGTVDIKNDLTGSIDLGNQFPDLFSAKINFTSIDGKAIKKQCDGNIKTREVKTTGNSTMSLKTGNTLFGNVKTVPAKGKSVSNNGKCKSGHYGCPSAGKTVSGYGYLPDNGYVGWSGNVNDAGSYGSIYVSTNRPIVPGASWSASYGGKVLKSRIKVADNLATGEIDADGLPKLSGKINASATSPSSTGPWYNCGKDKRYRMTSRGADRTGDLTWNASGTDPVTTDQEFSSEFSNIGKLQVGNR